MSRFFIFLHSFNVEIECINHLSKYKLLRLFLLIRLLSCTDSVDVIGEDNDLCRIKSLPQ